MKLGDSIRLECNASGDQPIQVDWFHEGQNTSIEKHGNEYYDIHEHPTEAGLSSQMIIRSISQSNALLYKCLAKNEFGSSERLIKLIVLDVPERPVELKAREVWSRSALISWTQPLNTTAASSSTSSPSGHQQSTNRVSNYTIQYWRKTSATPHWSSSASLGQNHRREQLNVDGLQTSALLTNLSPALTYEVSIIANNQVGQSEASETVQLTTSEEEPNSPPTDVQVEPKGGSTLRVSWKVPPIESLNGKLVGFYIGYRPRSLLINPNVISQQQQQLNSVQQQQQQLTSQPQQQQNIFSFKTADANEGQVYYDTFLGNLKHLHEYEVTVRAFNKAGSGPDCHLLIARTNSPRLPGPPALQVQRVTTNAISLKWSGPIVSSTAASQRHQLIPMLAAPQLSYGLFYQVQGEREWHELSVELSSPAQTPTSQDDMQSIVQPRQQIPADYLAASHHLADGSGMQPSFAVAHIHTLSNLQPGLVYRIYVAASNELGLGDPSNVLTVRTEQAANSTASGGAAISLDGASLLASSSSGGFLGSLTGAGNPGSPLSGFLYTILTSFALISMFISLIVYLVWQRRLRSKYNSSSGSSSYPTSWTPAASDTIQSEYSIKRHNNGPHLAQQHSLPINAGGGDVYDEVPGPLGPPINNQSSRPLIGSSGRPLNLNHHHHFATSQRMQSAKQTRANSTTQRPVLSSHYHQPADLISSAGTLQLHRQTNSSAHRLIGQTNNQKTMASTLNRHQNRQLPPIPYSTLSVKEMDSQRAGGQWQRSGVERDRQVANAPGGGGGQQSIGGCGSQTPLIYGVIE